MQRTYEAILLAVLLAALAQCPEFGLDLLRVALRGAVQ